MDGVCSICCENLHSEDANPTATRCGHVFHYVCLLKWLARTENCPQCRSEVTGSTIIPLHITSPNVASTSKEHKMQIFKEEIEQLRTKLAAYKTRYASLRDSKRKLEDDSDKLRRKLRSILRECRRF